MQNNHFIDNDFYIREEDLKRLEYLQEQMVSLISNKSNWESVNLNNQSMFAKDKDRHFLDNTTSKDILGIQQSSKIAYSPLLLRSLANIKGRNTNQQKQLIPIQQALLEKYAKQWEDTAGASYPFVRLNNEQKIEFGHLTEGLNKEDMSRFIVIDPKDHKMYSHKDIDSNNEKKWSPSKCSETHKDKEKKNIDYNR